MGTSFDKEFQFNLLRQMAVDRDFLVDAMRLMQLSDLDLPACRLIFEALRSFYGRFNQLPNANQLSMHIMAVYENIDGKTKTFLAPEELEALTNTVHYIVGYMREQPSTVEIAANRLYYKGNLSDFLKLARTRQALMQHSSSTLDAVGAKELLDKMSNIRSNMLDQDTELKLESMSEHPDPILDMTDSVRRISTGLRFLNDHTAGGLGVGEQGLITACPGVGKTTLQLNFMFGAILHGVQALFVTLELSSKRIKHRYQSIAAGIDARYFKVPIKHWPAHIMKRYNDLITPELNPYYGYDFIVDGSKGSTIDEIDVLIGRYQDAANKRFGNKAAPLAVYVDWLDMLSPEGLGAGKDAKDFEIAVKHNKRLGALARKYGVALWTATQGKQEADGKERLSKKDTSQGYHKNDAIDVGVGLGVVNQDEDQVTFQDNDAVPGSVYDPHGIVNIDLVAPPCDRELVLTITKNRDNREGTTHLFQGKTLQIFNHRLNMVGFEETLDSSSDPAAMRKYQRETVGFQKQLT